jgi:hypothetical protein
MYVKAKKGSRKTPPSREREKNPGKQFDKLHRE